jgi:hypothetical protein
VRVDGSQLVSLANLAFPGMPGASTSVCPGASARLIAEPFSDNEGDEAYGISPTEVFPGGG